MQECYVEKFELFGKAKLLERLPIPLQLETLNCELSESTTDVVAMVDDHKDVMHKSKRRFFLGVESSGFFKFYLFNHLNEF